MRALSEGWSRNGSARTSSGFCQGTIGGGSDEVRELPTFEVKADRFVCLRSAWLVQQSMSAKRLEQLRKVLTNEGLRGLTRPTSQATEVVGKVVAKSSAK